MQQAKTWTNDDLVYGRIRIYASLGLDELALDF